MNDRGTSLKHSFVSIDNLIDNIFCNIPKSPCYYNIDNNINIVFLTHLMLAGANKLFGNITPTTITQRQFEKLNECMESIGYTIKYTVNTNPNLYKIWFERYIEKTNCHGFKTML